MIAQASETHDLLWAAIIPACLAFLGATLTAVIAWSTHRSAKNVQEQVRPENGVRMGTLLEQVSKTADAIDGRVHDNSKRTGRLEETVDRMEEKVEAAHAIGVNNRDLILDGNERLETVETKLDGHIEDTAPLLARAIRAWGIDGTKEE